MRKTLIGASLALALLPALALAQRDVVTIGMQQEPTGLDPTQDATAAIEAILSHNVIESLTSLDSKGQV
ncbi:MAG: ABC transporter substrate-binding protein, partial [Alphaproteobacteria bacterium]|nr:ABC transporter substrate-binding protein [Alphaproteobacteria bacterium]